MLVELGNHAAKNAIDRDLPARLQIPKVTYIHIPEFDSTGQGGYTHEPGLSVAEFRAHRQRAFDYHDGITRLPEHEALLSIVNAWPAHATEPPAWVKVTSHHELLGLQVGHDPAAALDVEGFLREFYELSDGAVRPDDLEDRYWTRHGQPGVYPGSAGLPDQKMILTNAGRVIANLNDGGGQVGTTGTGTAATATTFTTNLTLTTNAWAGYRIYVMQTATGPMVWANVLSNTNAAGASVVTIDRWYNAATPGGAAATTPSAGFYFMLADGGSVSAWFIGMTTTNITPAATDTTLSGEYVVGTPAGATSSSGMLRKISPYSQTSGVATRSITLTPVWTAVAGQETFPSTFFALGVSCSMIPTAGLLKFEPTLNASATINAGGDQVSATETVNGS